MPFGMVRHGMVCCEHEVLIDALNCVGFIGRQRREFVGSDSFREAAGVLAQEAHHKVECRVRHFDKPLDPALGLVVTAKIVDFGGKRAADCLDHAPRQNRRRKRTGCDAGSFASSNDRHHPVITLVETTTEGDQPPRRAVLSVYRAQLWP